MLTLFRWLLRLTVGLIIGAVIVTTLIWYFATRSLPDYDATYRVSGLSGPVQIIRSTENVPHIFGDSDTDVFFALGVAHAQDRLFQMTVLRRAAQGRLSEIYGPATYRADDLARRLALHRNARASFTAQDEQTRAALEAYSAGVNEWIGQINQNALGRGAPEFFLYPDDIAYWQPADSLAILKLVAASSSTAVRDEVLRARLSIASPDHGPELAALPGDPALPVYASQFPGTRLPPQDSSQDAEPWSQLLAGYLAPGIGLSGNAFAAPPDRTAAAGSLLANDPQGPLTAPALWYLARLQLSDGGVIGGTIPGIPAILSGRNAQMAWGMTPAAIDDTDIFIEELQPGDITRFRSPDGWTDFQSRREVIRIRDAADQPITLRWTGNGPVLPGVDFGLAQVTPAGHVAAIAWTGASQTDTTMSALIGLMHSDTRADAQAALDAVVAPALQVTLADAGGVDQVLAGQAPRRAADNPSGGLLPAPGWDRRAAWQDTGPAAELLAGRLPATGKDGIVMATGEPGPRGGPRLSRLSRQTDDREVQSRDSFIAIQLDVVSPVARSLLPLVGANLWFTGEPAARGTPERQRQDALTLLSEWDGEMNEHLPEPAIYAAWIAALQDRLIRDELGPLAEDITTLHPDFIEGVFRNRNGMSRWCDVIQSAPVEDCATIARQSLDAAILELTDHFGPDVTSWRWGDLHVATHVQPALGRLPGLGWAMNLTQSTSGGSFTLAQAGLLGTPPDPYRNVTGAGYRGVYDLADPDSSVFVISTGQSGHPLSRHYDDLAELWRRGEYIGMSLDPELARAAATGITQLLPAEN